MYNRIYNFLDKNNIMNSFQFGFLRNYSTYSAYSTGNFVDLQKAIDTVDHSIFFLSKLCHYGIRGLTNKWFESYLTNRK